MAGSAGERIRLARKRKGWTQKDLAEAVGCSQQTIVDIEGAEEPRSRFLTAIVRSLGESLEWIEAGVGGPASGNGDLALLLPHYDFEVAALRALDPTAVDHVIDALYQAPVEMSSASFTVGVDRMTARLMPEAVQVDDVLFVDPLADPQPGRMVLAVMPGWDRAELRALVSSAGQRFLGIEAQDMGETLVPCTPYRTAPEFLDHRAVTEGGAPDPALIVGVVVFIGREV
jgi:transcriptional regulator with XRE-family HTH domain